MSNGPELIFRMLMLMQRVADDDQLEPEQLSREHGVTDHWTLTGHEMGIVCCFILSVSPYPAFIHHTPIIKSASGVLHHVKMYHLHIRIPIARINDFSITPLKHQLCEIQDKLIILIFIFIVSCSSDDDQLCEVFNELRNELFDMDEDQDNEEG